MQSRHGLDRLGWGALAPPMRPLWERRFAAPAPYLAAAVAAERARLAARRRTAPPGGAGAVAVGTTAIGHKFQLGYLGAPPNTVEGYSKYLAADATHMSARVFRRAFLDDAAWREVLLYRCDVLAQWASYWRAMRARNWTDARPCRGTMRFDRDRYLRFKRHQDSWSALLFELLSGVFARCVAARVGTCTDRVLSVSEARYGRASRCPAIRNAGVV